MKNMRRRKWFFFRWERKIKKEESDQCVYGCCGILVFILSLYIWERNFLVEWERNLNSVYVNEHYIIICCCFGNLLLQSIDYMFPTCIVNTNSCYISHNNK
jgi:hypothetical protein